MKVSVYIATSVDGFIARPDGSLDWLPGMGGPGGEDYGYGAFFTSVDALAMGRETFEKVLSFDPWPYGDKRVVVLTHRPLEVPARLSATVEAMAGTPREVVERLAARGLRHLYLDGGKTIQGFLAAGLVQQLILTRVPVLIGEGRPLFGPLPHDLPLRHLETRAYPNGLVQSRYEVLTPEAG